MLPLSSYNTIIFDCDGVILNSNKAVSKCFFNTVIEYGEPHALELEAFNKLNGGVSRNKKFDHFFKNILKKNSYEVEYREALKIFSDLSMLSRLECDINKSFLNYKLNIDQRFMVISGANQEELNKIFELRGIKDFFNFGIFGSPDDKDKIIKREIKNTNIVFPALYIGDSKYDHIVSINNGLDFVFISNWTEFSDWQIYSDKHELECFESLDCVFKW
tara:strand:- start:7437 stop:8090 length:654 start_codon:yes stop_codon:yes gene_type:complete